MDITPLIPKGNNLVKSYGNSRFNISGQYYDGPVFLFPYQVLPWEKGNFLPIFEASPKPELLLIGTGKSFESLPAEMVDLLRSKQIKVEVMDTGAACRTYNVLLSEGRHIVAALQPV